MMACFGACCCHRCVFLALFYAVCLRASASLPSWGAAPSSKREDTLSPSAAVWLSLSLARFLAPNPRVPLQGLRAPSTTTTSEAPSPSSQATTRGGRAWSPSTTPRRATSPSRPTYQQAAMPTRASSSATAVLLGTPMPPVPPHSLFQMLAQGPNSMVRSWVRQSSSPKGRAWVHTPRFRHTTALRV